MKQRRGDVDDYGEREYHYWHLTDAIQYTLRHREHRSPLRRRRNHAKLPCGFMVAAVSDGPRLHMPCSSCGGDDYYPSCQRQLTAALQSHYPYVSGGCADTLVETFTDLLESANAAYKCPRRPRVKVRTTHAVQIEVDPLSAPGPAAEEEECVICMEALEARSTRTLGMPCAHTFHEACIVRWLDNSRFCPLCRYQLPAHES